MQPEFIERKKYPSFGECIYCRKKPPDVVLNDEHIVPFSLNGNAIACGVKSRPKCLRRLAPPSRSA